jgi:hypothetical protein
MEMKNLGLWIGLFTILALIGCGSAAHAYPSLLGVTGGVQTPSPEVVPAGQYDLAVDYTQLKSGDISIQTWPIRLVGGASDRAELGIAYARLKPDDGDTGRITDIGGKYVFWKEPEKPYSIAVGANYASTGGGLRDASNVDNAARVYAVIGKDLTAKYGAYEEKPKTKAFGYVGLMYTRIKDGGTETFTRPFAGLELKGDGGGSLLLEWKSEKFGDDVTSAVLRYQFNPTLMAEVGATKNFGGFGEGVLDQGHRVFVGLNYRFGTSTEGGYGW